MIDGVVKGQNLQNLFSDLTIGYHDSVDFNSFLIPFACVAVDMVSGKDYVFHKGCLPLAMRASMAIPAVFTPVRLDSMVLVDGGLNNNYPVDVALAMGADIVIGVDLATSDLRSYDRLHSPGDIATQIIALHGHDKYERNRDRTDLLFRPDMEPYRSSSFAPAALDTMLHRGEADARRRWNEIMALKRRIGLSDTDTFSIQSRRLAHRPVLPADTFYVRHIRFDGADPRDLNWLHRICALKENSHITLKELRKSMSILVGTNAYAYVNYKLTGESQQDLVLTLQPTKADALYWLGESYYRLNRMREAARNFNEYLSLTRQRDTEMFALAYYNLGYIAFHQKDYSTAENRFRNFVQLEKGENPTALADAVGSSLSR